MKRWIPICALAVMISGWSVAARQQAPEKHLAGSATTDNPGFERIKTLAGEWEGTASGIKVETSFNVVSDGSAVLNILKPAGEPEMVTMFHLDGPDVMVTHYCSAGNRARMVCRAGDDPNQIAFVFKDATNLASPAAQYKRAVMVTLTDAAHHEQTWTFSQSGKEQSEVFEFTRKAVAK